MNNEIRNKFPIFRNVAKKYVYLDSAATTQVPQSVMKGVREAMEFRGNPSRSMHPFSLHSEEKLSNARKTIASFIGADSSEIVFTKNSTDSINIAVDTLADKLEAGDSILLPLSEHHSNMLPYVKLRNRCVKMKIIEGKEGIITSEQVVKALCPQTKIVAFAHASNVYGCLNDVKDICKAVKEYNHKIICIIDGAQAVAHIPVDVKDLGCDMYAFSGHKMYGPDGIGVLYINSEIHSLISPIRPGGGTVSNVALTRLTDYDIISPDYYSNLSVLEGGTPNVAGAHGLALAVKFIQNNGFEKIRTHETELLSKLIKGLDDINGVIVHGCREATSRAGLVSFGLLFGTPKELADNLAKDKICVRYGAHCAFPLADSFGHETVRVSLGAYNTEEEIDFFLNRVQAYFEKKRGKFKNPNLKTIKDIEYSRINIVLKNKEDIKKLVDSYTSSDTEVVVMGGHFLGIPDVENNTFYPSIAPMLPYRLHNTLDEFGMTTFPLVTLDLATDIISENKSKGISSKLLLLANDTTGINELRLSTINKDKKSAGIYRDELLSRFVKDGEIPEIYKDMLEKKDLGIEDLVNYKGKYFLQETVMRRHFKDFIDANKNYFEGLIDYKSNDESIDMSINVLDDQQIKTCVFDTFHSKTGGKFCIVELAQIIAELFGKAKKVNYDYINSQVLNPIITKKNKIFVMLSPAMCNNAVNKAAELYIKLFKQGYDKGNFTFINIPFGPHSETNLEMGIEATITTA